MAILFGESPSSLPAFSTCAAQFSPPPPPLHSVLRLLRWCFKRTVHPTPPHNHHRKGAPEAKGKGKGENPPSFDRWKPGENIHSLCFRGKYRRTVREKKRGRCSSFLVRNWPSPLRFEANKKTFTKSREENSLSAPAFLRRSVEQKRKKVAGGHTL